MKKLLLLIVLIAVGTFFLFDFTREGLDESKRSELYETNNVDSKSPFSDIITKRDDKDKDDSLSVEDKGSTTLKTPPESKVLPTNYHIFQTFNNCGPASLSMALSHYGINVSQKELGDSLRPYQNPQGDNDDKSVTLEELAEESKKYGFVPYRRPMGDMEVIKYFISYDIPVITRTWLKPNDDIGHYRVIKGYDVSRNVVIQDDSLQGANLEYTLKEFNEIWEKFNYEFLVLVPEDKVEIANQILGENADFQTSWQNAVELTNKELEKNPNNVDARFNLSVALYNIGEYEKSISEFEKVQNELSFRTLWYQIEPIKAYFEVGNYDKVFSITSDILNNQNRAFTELYLLRGNSYIELGQTEKARQEFEKAVLYNKNKEEAIQALESLQL